MTLRYFNILSLAILLVTYIPGANAQQSELDKIQEGIEFDMPKIVEPTFPDYSVSIVDFGAVGDGLTKNSEAFAKAITDVVGKGGGTVIIPRGIWYTGPITLKSNIRLHTEKGALIIFSDDFDDYPLVKTSFEGLNTYRCISPINGENLENIAITGDGIFDGSGGAWRPVKKGKMTPGQWESLVKSGGVLSDDGRIWYPTEESKSGAASTGNFNVPDGATTKEDYEKFKDFLRPVMVSLVKCKNVMLDGPTFQNSPAWNLHPLMCENVILRNLTVRNPWFSQNGDGLDLESCKNALVYNNSFDVGDDAICIKSGKNEDGRERGIPTENVIIKNNIVYHGHGGFVVGSEMSGGVKNVHVSNCTFIGTDTGLRFKSTRGRGGVVEKIYISNIDMIDIPTEPIRFNLFYGGNSPVIEEDQEDDNPQMEAEVVPVTEETPSFRDIHMKNITATGSGQAGFFQGLPEMNLKNITLTNAVLEAKKGITCIDVQDMKFENVTVLQGKGLPMTIYNGQQVVLDGFDYPDEREVGVRVLGSKSENILISGENFENAGKQVAIGSEVPKGTVKIK